MTRTIKLVIQFEINVNKGEPTAEEIKQYLWGFLDGARVDEQSIKIETEYDE